MPASSGPPCSHALHRAASRSSSEPQYHVHEFLQAWTTVEKEVDWRCQPMCFVSLCTYPISAGERRACPHRTDFRAARVRTVRRKYSSPPRRARQCGEASVVVAERLARGAERSSHWQRSRAPAPHVKQQNFPSQFTVHFCEKTGLSTREATKFSFTVHSSLLRKNRTVDMPLCYPKRICRYAARRPYVVRLWC